MEKIEALAQWKVVELGVHIAATQMVDPVNVVGRADTENARKSRIR